MAKYRITAPDGSVHEIIAPDTASQDDVMQYAMRTLGKESPQTPAPEAKPDAAPQTPAKPDVPIGPDMAKSLGSGAVTGAVGFAALPHTALSLAREGGKWLGKNVMGLSQEDVDQRYANAPDTSRLFPSFDNLKTRVEGVTGKLYEPQTTAGKYAHTVGEFATGLAFPGGVAQRVVGNVVAPALASEAAGQATEGTSLEPLARVAGALAGGRIANMPARAYTPAPAPAARRAQVATLENEGVTALTAGQQTGSLPLRYAEDAAVNTPGSGSRAADMKALQGQQFTRAALRRAGIDADNVLPEVMDPAFAQIGARFDRLAQQTTARLNRADQMRIDATVRDYLRVTPPNNVVPAVREYVANIRSHAGNPIPGDVYARYRSEMERAARGLQPRDPHAADALRDIRNVLDDAAERSLPQGIAGDWREVRRHYRNLLVVERAAQSAAATDGVLTPAALLQATKAVQGKRAYVRGQGDYADLARSAKTILSELPNSGTAQRHAAMQMGTMAAGGALGAFGYGGPEGAAGGAVAPFLVRGMMARAMMSRPMQAYLANQAIPNNVVNARRSAYAATPAAAVQSLGLLDDPQRRYPRYF